ncbi:hypothetical protein D3C75_1214250 [compost metagenome]
MRIPSILSEIAVNSSFFRSCPSLPSKRVRYIRPTGLYIFREPTKATRTVAARTPTLTRMEVSPMAVAWRVKAEVGTTDT